MLIDWFTVGGQALNFAILVWLLKRFLYRPILAAIDAREKLIAAELTDAAEKKAGTEKDRDDFLHKNEVFDKERAGLLSQATKEAASERQRLVEAARKDVEVGSVQRQETLKTEILQLNQVLRLRTQKEVFAIARKTLTDLAAANLETQLCRVFIERLRGLAGEVKGELATALKTAADSAVVRSAFELPSDQRDAIHQALNEIYVSTIPLRFETNGDLVCGIELTANGQKWAWSIGDYLEMMEKGVGEILEVRTKRERLPEADPKTAALLVSA